ncbi:hypothetical protein PPERSA_06108 [Pseudocohnilembus persalinus]|uniref:sn-1-specific diacylglycerol lipase n=1 Tax=Pseudocohnilembus persalinus TaxID=266149 RepID=A0A0V0QVH0_PSEPJ|nr:hypothetical protein PPERSA_06108 [Pseudocohnilembus persalinus]|eukprot:KRX06226.1 hypothetical protein PPERSA_06108 [Pseudocohnilembus persalinus]
MGADPYQNQSNQPLVTENKQNDVGYNYPRESINQEEPTNIISQDNYNNNNFLNQNDQQNNLNEQNINQQNVNNNQQFQYNQGQNNFQNGPISPPQNGQSNFNNNNFNSPAYPQNNNGYNSQQYKTPQQQQVVVENLTLHSQAFSLVNGIINLNQPYNQNCNDKTDLIISQDNILFEEEIQIGLQQKQKQQNCANLKQTTQNLQQDKNSQNLEISNKNKNQVKLYIQYGLWNWEKLALKPIEFLEQITHQSKMRSEQKLKDYGINVNDWVFSSENLEIIDKITNFIEQQTLIVKHIGSVELFQLMLNFRILQKICQNYNEKLLFGNLEQIKQVNTKLDKQMFIEFQEYRNQKQLNSIPIQSEKYQELEKKRLIFKYYSKYANAGYGDSISSGKGIHKTIRIQNQTEEFIQHIGIDRKNLLFQQWKTQPNKPAYCICADEQNKSIVVTVRGSSDINDAITDLTCSLIDFSIIEDSQTQFVKYLKINKNVYHTQDFQGNHSTESFNLIDQKQEINKVQEDLIQDENDISGTNFQKKEDFTINTQKEIIRGQAHSGILLASINLFKEIVPKLNQIFEQYSPYEYDLVVTGHSLGGD